VGALAQAPGLPLQRFVHGASDLPAAPWRKGLTFVLAKFVDGADVGMIQRRSSARLAAEALKGLMILGQFFAQELERHESMQLGVLGFVDHTHPSAPSFSRVRLWEMLFGSSWQLNV
jgi:hypothetical protein